MADIREREAERRRLAWGEHDDRQIADLVARLLHGPPSGGLAAVRELRRLLDDLERWHVTRARRQGWAWAEIARVLGRHRQSVHRSYAGDLG